MIKVILKAFLLMTFTVAAGLSPVSLVSHAQQSTVSLTGEWVGNSEPAGRVEFLHFSLTENAGELVSPLKAKLTLVQREGSRIRIELSSLKLVMTGTLTDDVIEGEADVPGIKAPFRLMRTVKVAPEILARYVGAYRFRNGDYIVIDRFPNTQDTLWVTDVKSGQTRTIFPRSETQFTGGPALYVASPTRQTLTFRDNGGHGGVHVVDLDHKDRQSGAFATRVPIRQEEVTFKNGDVTLAGTLLLPAREGKASRTRICPWQWRAIPRNVLGPRIPLRRTRVCRPRL